MAQQANLRRPPGGTVTGHFWRQRLGVSPCIVTAMDVVDRPIGETHTFRHQQWVLDYAFTDAGVFRIGSRRAPEHTRHARLLRLIAPGTFRWYDLRAARPPVHAAFIMFAADPAIDLHRLTRAGDGYLGIDDTTGELGALMRRAAAIGQQRQASGFWLAQAVLMALLDRIVAGRDETSFETDELVRQVRQVIEQHYARRLTLDEIARRARVSVSTLTHTYRQRSGQTPMQTLLEVRVRAAMLRLLQGEKLAAIATEVGFSDGFHLSRAFKRCTGLSPRQWLAQRSQ